MIIINIQYFHFSGICKIKKKKKKIETENANNIKSSGRFSAMTALLTALLSNDSLANDAFAHAHV